MRPRARSDTRFGSAALLVSRSGGSAARVIVEASAFALTETTLREDRSRVFARVDLRVTSAVQNPAKGSVTRVARAAGSAVPVTASRYCTTT